MYSSSRRISCVTLHGLPNVLVLIEVNLPDTSAAARTVEQYFEIESLRFNRFLSSRRKIVFPVFDRPRNRFQFCQTVIFKSDGKKLLGNERRASAFIDLFFYCFSLCQNNIIISCNTFLIFDSFEKKKYLLGFRKCNFSNVRATFEET